MWCSVPFELEDDPSSLTSRPDRSSGGFGRRREGAKGGERPGDVDQKMRVMQVKVFDVLFVGCILVAIVRSASAGFRINEAIKNNNYWGMVGVKKWHQLGTFHPQEGLKASFIID